MNNKNTAIKDASIATQLKMAFAAVVVGVAINYASDRAELNWPRIGLGVDEPPVHSCEGIIPELEQACKNGTLKMQPPG